MYVPNSRFCAIVPPSNVFSTCPVPSESVSRGTSVPLVGVTLANLPSDWIFLGP